MANSFYGNNSNLSITFDKIYSNYTEMDNDIDNIYLNRYVFIDGNDTNYPFTVWKKSLVSNEPVLIQVGKLDLSIFENLGATLGNYNKEGFEYETVSISNETGSIELSGITDENNNTKAFTLNLPEIGDAIAKMWNIVYGLDTENQSRYINIEFNHDETNRTYDLAILAGCINNVQSLIGREILYIQDDDNYPSLENFKNNYPDKIDKYGFLIYFDKQNDKYYKVIPLEKDASTAEVTKVESKELSLDFNDVGETSLYSFLVQVQELYDKYTGVFGEESGLYVGRSLENKEVYPENSEVTVVSGEKAEIFNDYRERIYINDFGAFSGNIASGSYSHAEGEITTAATEASHAEGFKTLVSSDINRINSPIQSESMEENIWTNMPNGCGGHAEGFNTLISGKAAHAEGKSSLVTGHAAHGEGANSIATGDYSHAEGSHTIASGQAAHAEGNGGEAEGVCSHVEGQGSNAIGYGSHAEGGYTQANNNYSHAEGYNTEAAGESSHAEGAWTISSGNNSHAEGQSTNASGEASHAGGIGTIAEGLGQTVVGYYNQPNTTDLFIIGNGTDGNNRSNALSVTKRGDLLLCPNLSAGTYFGIANQDNLQIGFWYNDKHGYCIAPKATNQSNLGNENYFWKNIYSAKALNIVSDIRLKDVQNNNILDSLLKMYETITPIAYKFKNISEADNHDRVHIGLSSQEVEQKLIENGLTRSDFGGLLVDPVYEKDENGNETNKIVDEQYGLRYGEFHGLHILKNQQQDARISELEEKVSNLENELAEIKALLLKNNIS